MSTKMLSQLWLSKVKLIGIHYEVLTIMLPAIFNNQPIRQIEQNGRLWISLTDCIKSGNKGKTFLSDLLKTEGFIATSQAIVSLNNHTHYVDELICIIRGNSKNNALPQGTWLDINCTEGLDLLIYVAQQINPEFYAWTLMHTRELMQTGYTISEFATNDQLAELEARLNRTTKQLKSRTNELKRLVAKFDADADLSEAELSNLLHILWTRLGLSHKSEQSFKTSLGIARFDSINFARNVVNIFELKKDWINSKTAVAELFGDKQYLAKCKELWPTKQIKFWFVSPFVDKADLHQWADQMQSIFGDNFRVHSLTIGRAYFDWAKDRFINNQLDNGLTFTQAERAWLSSGCADLINKLS